MDPFDWSILRSTAFFKSVPAEDALLLTGNRKPHVYDKNTTLFRQGEPASAFFVVLSGWVKLYRITRDGLEVVINVFTTGDTFAEAAMFLGADIRHAPKRSPARGCCASTRPCSGRASSKNRSWRCRC